MIIDEIIKAGFGIVKDSVLGVTNRVVNDKVKEEAIRKELEKAINETVEVTREALESEIKAKTEIIIKELSQGNEFTKNMRPFIGYSGVVLLFVVHVIVPMVEAITGVDIPIDIPGAFWAAWSGITGLYVLGRSAEKRGGTGLLTQLLNGTTLKKLL